MGRKTSVYLADDILAALADDPRPLAEVIRAGLGISDQAVEPEPAEDPLRVQQRELARLRIRARWGDAALGDPDDEPTVGRGRTADQVDQLRQHGGDIILAEPGEPQPEPELGDRHIRFTQPGE